MSELIASRMQRFRNRNIDQERQSLREVVQEATLAGLWRAKFFEHAAFYGGTALRIFHNLDRFSEDLDFTLLRPTPNFQLKNYLNALKDELAAIGFDARVESKKSNATIESAFVKAETLKHLLLVKSPFKTHKDELVQVKIEIDTDPALGFGTEAKVLMWPYLHSVLCCDLSSLFAGKIHALLCRKVVRNVKGRDWYDFLWYLSRKVPFNKAYLKAKLAQSGFDIRESELLLPNVISFIQEKIDQLDLDAAKKDIVRFIPNPSLVDGWTKENLKAASMTLTMI